MFSIDYKSRLPIYEQLYNQVAMLSALGALSADEKLPAVRQLAGQLGVNPNTVQKAYQMLERDGLIYSAAGKGSFIAQDPQAVRQRKEMGRQRLKEALRFAAECGLQAQEIAQIVAQFSPTGGTHD